MSKIPGRPRLPGEGSHYMRASPEFREKTILQAQKYYEENKERLNEERMRDYTCPGCGTVMLFQSKYQHTQERCEHKVRSKALKEQKAREREEKIKAGTLKPRRPRNRTAN